MFSFVGCCGSGLRLQSSQNFAKIELESVVRELIDYTPLWRTMKEKGVTQYTLIYKLGFSAYTITNLKRGKSITMHTLQKLCLALDCTPNDIVSFSKDEQ